MWQRDLRSRGGPCSQPRVSENINKPSIQQLELPLSGNREKKNVVWKAAAEHWRKIKTLSYCGARAMPILEGGTNFSNCTLVLGSAVQ